MKNTFKIISHASLFLLFTFALSACSKDPSNTPINTSGPFGFEFTVDGQKYSWYGNPIDNKRISSDNACIYIEDTSGSFGALFTKNADRVVSIGIGIKSKTVWKLGSRVFDNNSGTEDEIMFEGEDLGINTKYGTSQTAGSSVTLTVTEKGGIFGHVKGNFYGTLINSNTLKPMTISGTFDLCRTQ